VSDASDNRIDRYGLIACLLIALVLRGIAVRIHADELTHDRDVYLGMAQGIAEGRGLCSPGSTTPTAFRPPLYPLMIGGLLVAVPAGIAVALVNGLFGVATVWATHCIGRRLGLGRVSLIAALLVAVDPLLLQYTAQPMTETPCAGLVALLLLSMVSDESRSPRREWIGGALFGLLVLCRPTFWPLVGLTAASWSLIRWRGTEFTIVADAASVGQDAGSIHHEGIVIDVPAPSVRFLSPRGLPWRAIVGTMLVVAPWVIRNQIVMGAPLLTTTHGGYTLLLANNPVFYGEVVDHPWGTVWDGDSLARWQAEQNERLERDLGSGASEIERDRRLNSIAREFIAAEPKQFARAAWHRVRSLWSVVPQGDTTNGPSRWVIGGIGLYYSITLLAFAIGMIVVARRPDSGRWWLLYALVVTVQTVHLAYWTNARMRAPLTPVIALFAAACFAGRAKQTSPEAPTLSTEPGAPE